MQRRKIFERIKRPTLFDLVLLAPVIGAGLGIGKVLEHSDRETYRATVTEKVVKKDSGEDIYLIFTKLQDGEVRVFENTDSLLERKFNSSDVYAKIQSGKTYDFSTYGWRFQPLSVYENILEAREITSDVKKDQLPSKH